MVAPLGYRPYGRCGQGQALPLQFSSALLAFERGLCSVLARLRPILACGRAELIAEQVEQEQRAESARAVAVAARSHHVGRDADVLLADHFQSLDERDTLRAERVDLLAVGDALRLAH